MGPGKTELPARRGVAGTCQHEAETRPGWMEAGCAAIEASDDAFPRLAVALMPPLLRLEEETTRFVGESQRLQPAFMQAVMDYRHSQGRAVYPDANGGPTHHFRQRDGLLAARQVPVFSFTTLGRYRPEMALQ